MVALDRVVHEPKPETAVARGESTPDRSDAPLRAKARHIRPHPPRHVNGMRRVQSRACRMRNACLSSHWLTPSPLARATPCAEPQAELLRAASHLDSAYIYPRRASVKC